MRRAFLLMAICGLFAVACSGDTTASSPTPVATADIKRSKLDISYSGFVDQDVHHVTSRKALEAALEAVRAEVRAAGGKDDAPVPQFPDKDEPILDHLKKFAEGVNQLAPRTPQLSAHPPPPPANAGPVQ